MAVPPANPWQPLLSPESFSGALIVVPCRVLLKRGRPFLLLPEKPALAWQALSLYPAQTAKARWAKAVIAVSLRAGFYPSTKRIDLAIIPDAPFVKFLNQTAGSGELPPFAALAGNAATAGQRQVFLLFDREGRARWVIKTGMNEKARELIRAEVRVLRALGNGFAGAPTLLHEFQGAEAEAFASEYCAGDSPRSDFSGAPLELLKSWIHANRETVIADLPSWKGLAAGIANIPELSVLGPALARVVVRPAIFHGDFAPWNLKVSPTDGRWTVLDWERGELDGMPAWDWFHFVIQPEILVRHREPSQVVSRLETFIASPAFQSYAQAARIVGHEWALLTGYLAYVVHVLKPSEGLQGTMKLLKLALQRWPKT